MADDKYTKPELRKRIKREVQAGDKGGAPGQWSARKAQLVATTYKKRGGGYVDAKDAPGQGAGGEGGNTGKARKRPAKGSASAQAKPHKDAAQRSLDAWTQEAWTTADGSKARDGGKTKRYLPKKAWDELSAEEKAQTNAKKEAGSRRGAQFVANTDRAKAARKRASRKAKTRKATSRKATTRKATTRKATTRKATTRKATTRKATTRKATTRKATTRQATARKATTRKATARKATTRKAGQASGSSRTGKASQARNKAGARRKGR